MDGERRNFLENFALWVGLGSGLENITWTGPESDDVGNPGGVCGDSGDWIGELQARGGVTASDSEILVFKLSISLLLLFLSAFKFEICNKRSEFFFSRLTVAFSRLFAFFDS